MRVTKRDMVIAAALILEIGATGLFSRSVSARQPPESAREPQVVSIISDLDDCLQERFGDVNERFGMARIVKPGDTAHRFRPENAREMTAVRDLERANLHVVFYLAGRGVLKSMPGPGYWGEEHGWGIIKGPVQIASASVHRSAKDGEVAAPKPRDLWYESQRAMLAFGARDSYEFTNSGWRFIARPVRASDAVCLRCHGNSLGIGDPIGAALYGYR